MTKNIEKYIKWRFEVNIRQTESRCIGLPTQDIILEYDKIIKQYKAINEYKMIISNYRYSTQTK